MIHRAERTDAPAIARLLVAVQDQHVAKHPAVFRSFKADEAEAHIVAGIDAGVYAVHGSRHVDGMMKWSLQDRGQTLYTHAARYVLVDEISVDAAVRRQGIAQLLLSWVMERAREAGAERVQLDTWRYGEDLLISLLEIK